MEQLLALVAFFGAHWHELLDSFILLLLGLIGIFLLIPGDQPEKAMQAIVDFLKKFSVKKE